MCGRAAVSRQREHVHGGTARGQSAHHRPTTPHSAVQHAPQERLSPRRTLRLPMDRSCVVQSIAVLYTTRAQAVTVRGKCRLSGYCPRQSLYTHRLAAAEDSLSYLCTRVCRDTTCDLTFVPLRHLPPALITFIADVYPLVCVSVGTVVRCSRW